MAAKKAAKKTSIPRGGKSPKALDITDVPISEIVAMREIPDERVVGTVDSIAGISLGAPGDASGMDTSRLAEAQALINRRKQQAQEALLRRFEQVDQGVGMGDGQLPHATAVEDPEDGSTIEDQIIALLQARADEVGPEEEGVSDEFWQALEDGDDELPQQMSRVQQTDDLPPINSMLIELIATRIDTGDGEPFIVLFTIDGWTVAQITDPAEVEAIETIMSEGML